MATKSLVAYYGTHACLRRQAPVVKWISQLTSDQLFWVRVLAGAHYFKPFLTTGDKGVNCVDKGQTLIKSVCKIDRN